MIDDKMYFLFGKAGLVNVIYQLDYVSDLAAFSQAL